jgi:hypothetical protein
VGQTQLGSVLLDWLVTNDQKLPNWVWPTLYLYEEAKKPTRETVWSVSLEIWDREFESVQGLDALVYPLLFVLSCNVKLEVSRWLDPIWGVMLGLWRLNALEFVLSLIWFVEEPIGPLNIVSNEWTLNQWDVKSDCWETRCYALEYQLPAPFCLEVCTYTEWQYLWQRKGTAFFRICSTAGSVK